MKKKISIKPTGAELEILKVLWKSGSATVKIVNEELNKTREIGYTTTLKIMQIMFEKGILDRVKEGRSHIYKSLVDEKNTQNIFLETLLDTLFAGSAGKLVMQIMGNKKPTMDEIEEIRQYLDKIEGKK